MAHPSLNSLNIRSNPVFPPGAVLDEERIGRIEDWVVSTLDDRAKAAPDNDWMNSLDGITLTKKAPTVRKSNAKVPEQAGGWARFRLSKRRGIAIVSMTDQALIKEEDLAELTGDLLSLVEAGHRRIVLDFFAVERLSSWAAGALNDAIRRSLEIEGGAVKLSGVRPEVATIFAMTGLDFRVATYPDTASAVASLWPDLPELKPLPVSILAALMRAEEARPPRLDRAPTLSGPRFRNHPDPTDRAAEDQAMTSGARLIVQDGPLMGRPVALKGTKFVIGRGPESHLKVRSAAVSRSHASIERRGGRLYIRDLASTNGTYLNDRKLSGREAELRDGDTIRIGKVTFTLALGNPGDAPERLEEPFPGRARPDYAYAPAVEDGDDETSEYDLESLGEDTGLKYEILEGALIVTPLASELDDEEEVGTFRDALLALYERRLPKRVVINLTHVNHLSGRAIGTLVAHHMRLDRSGGALRVCLANPRVAVVLEQVKLGMLIDYHPTVDDAVIAAWPQPSASARA